ncbi:MAG: HAD family hydrolase [Treponemataceae bacterium]|nr:HAD family hydrolase [Treponemataceae bacterium]
MFPSSLAESHCSSSVQAGCFCKDICANVKVAVFDLGGTLMEYKGMHLSWDGYYKGAFEYVDNFLSLGLSAAQIENAVKTLKEYNPRIKPREKEIPAEKIFSDAVAGWKTNLPVEKIISAFFDSLSLTPVIYEDAVPVLQKLRDSGIKTAAFTDVASAMPDSLHKSYVAPLMPFFDLYVSSVSCGYRKPNPKGLRDIAEFFNVRPEELVMIGDTKRDILAAKSFGCASVLIQRENGFEPSDFGQDYTIHNALEVCNLIASGE